MTTLLVHSEHSPLIVHFPALAQMTIEQFYEFCQTKSELRIERTANGEVIIMPPTFSDTGNRNFNLAVQFGVWAEQDGTEIGFESSADFTLPNGATHSPNASWIRADRWNALSDQQKASFAPICPNFVIELRSASARLSNLLKLQEYIDNGAKLRFLLDRIAWIVHIYSSNIVPEIKESPDSVCTEPELPGFVLQMAKI